MGLSAPDYYAGALDPVQGAKNLFASAGWIRRRCNEILAEEQHDAFKVYDLASNCHGFRLEADKWRSGTDFVKVLVALRDLTRTSGINTSDKSDAAINEDYRQLYDAAGVYLTWATANLPKAGTTMNSPIVTINRTWPSPDITVRIAKRPAILEQCKTLLRVFD